MYTVPREKEELFRKAADMINSKFNVYRTAQPNHSADRYSTTVLVDFAMQILQMQQEKRRGSTSSFYEAAQLRS